MKAMIKCPVCENEISEDSTVCKYCGTGILTGKNHFEKKFKKYCKKCGGGIDPNTKICTKCGKRYFKFNFASFLIGATVMAVILTVVFICVVLCDSRLYRNFHCCDEEFSFTVVGTFAFLLILWIVCGIMSKRKK